MKKHLTPWQLFGIDCGEGWKNLYIPILNFIQKYNSTHSQEEQIEILQVKEKWGLLEIYVNKHIPKLEYMINEARSSSKFICSSCGKERDNNITFNFSTLCEECKKEF